MKHYLLFIAIIFSSFETIKAQNNDHLESLKPFEIEGKLSDYRNSLKTKLDSESENKHIFSILCIPAFSPESYVFMYKENGLYFISTNKLSENYHYSKKKTNITVEKNISPISNDLGITLSKYFSKTVSKTDVYTTGKSWSPITDATILYIESNKATGTLKIGSKENGNEMNKLIQIHKTLLQFTKNHTIDLEKRLIDLCN